MLKHAFIYILGALCVPIIVAASPPSELPVTISERGWLTEAEFALDESLHATELQTIVLDLESSADEQEKNGQRFRQNILRFMVEKQRKFSFCIPEDEPHMVRVKLKRTHGRTLLNNRVGGDCEPVVLSAGTYELQVFHDSHSVPPGGRKAFLHDPETPLLLGADPSVGQPDFMAFKASNDLFVSTPASSTFLVAATASSITGRETFRLSPGLSGRYLMNDADGNILISGGADLVSNPQPYIYYRNLPFDDTPINDNFIFHDLGNWKFNLDNYWVWVIGPKLTVFSTYPVSRDSDTNGLWSDGFLPPTYETFTAAFKGFDCDAGCDSTKLTLAEGEMALFSECNYGGTGAVSIADVNVFSELNANGPGPSIGPQTVKSARVGPGTFALLYTEENFQGALQGISGDTACLSESATVGSFKVLTDAKTFVLTTNKCISCNLQGIDLSGYDLSHGIYTNSIFTGADLAGTRFDSALVQNTHFTGALMTSASFKQANLAIAYFTNATLDHANFEGAKLASTYFLTTKTLDNANFANANLDCTSFAGSDITTATFDPVPDINRAYDCQFATDNNLLDLSNTILEYGTFPDADWRYINLKGSVMNNVPGVLSSADNPLDLSGVNLSNVNWLAGKQLDSVNLGCYVNDNDPTTVCPAPSGTPHCSTLQGTVLTSASLKNTCLQNASMEGIFLSFSNLDGADLSGVQLEALTGGKVATLQGAFMRNVILSGANLTGVNASDISFYTVAGGTADATDMTAPGANFSGAYLALADFSGSTANLQSTIWTNAMLLGANFTQTDLTTNTSGGVNSGTNTTFSGAYLQGTIFTDALLKDVDFTNTYWDALGTGGKFNFLIPKGNLQFKGYWKDISLPECPPSVTYISGNLPPLNVTDASNTCPDADPGPCDTVWDQPKLDISLAFYPSTLPPAFPQDSTASPENQCSSNFSDPNPEDFCWITTNNPALCSEN